MYKMICPHCGYSHGNYDFDTKKISEGKKGDFYTLPTKMRRPYRYYNDEPELYGCPGCKKTFID